VWGQRLFHNQDGQRASLTGQRMSDYVAGDPQTIPPDQDDDRSPERRAGLNMVLLIQIPLKQKEPMRFGAFAGEPGPPGPPGALAMKQKRSDRGSDVEEAVIGHGAYEGPFTEIDNLAIERDTRYPVRVTVQFYKATSNGVVSAEDMRTIKEQIDRV